jgi:translocation and assembly module TamB
MRLQLLPTLLMAVLVLLFSTAPALWWWSGTELAGVVLRRIARSQPLTSPGVRGSLRSGLHVQRLVWEREGLKIEADDALPWQPFWLLEGIIQNPVRAATLRITDRRPPSRAGGCGR